MIFNSYDENGVRITVTGCTSTKTADDNLLYNLRFRWKDAVAHISDAALINAYDEFSLTDMFGDNDARFLDFIKELEF